MILDRRDEVLSMKRDIQKRLSDLLVAMNATYDGLACLCKSREPLSPEHEKRLVESMGQWISTINVIYCLLNSGVETDSLDVINDDVWDWRFKVSIGDIRTVQDIKMLKTYLGTWIFWLGLFKDHLCSTHTCEKLLATRGE